ncbi:hypothetical protein [Palaeococcus ferrophilus]|uniref:hypothetical protein n=1 Tax=Palaeococcus ferrophilus TaxID=83868 RepID=UPI00064F11EE|nr:hypothetical protein [Palaeococcus ferrophilus]
MKRVVTVLMLLALLSGLGNVHGAVLISNPKPPIVLLGTPYPQYLSVLPNETFDAYFYIVEDIDVEEINFYYRVNEGEWIKRYSDRVPINENPAMYDYFFSRFTTTNFTLRTEYRKAEIPPQPAGSRVEFKVVVKDKEGHVVESERGFYIVSNPEGTRVLIVDPTIEARLFIQNWENIEAMVNGTKKGYPYNLSDYESRLSELAPLRGYIDFLPEHHWELLGERYRIGIISPDELEGALEDFNPKVVILSNLWRNEWSLSEGEVAELVDYLRSVNGGLIVTHGTLYDGTVYADGTVEMLGTRNIGTLKNFKKSLATALGLYMLPLVESTKDESLKAGKAAIAEIPAVQPFIPSTGKLISKDLSLISGPVEFANGTYGEFGWQYLLPESSIGFAKEKIRAKKKDFKPVLEKLMNVEAAKFGKAAYDKALYALDFPLVDAVRNAEFADDSVSLTVGTDTVTVSPDPSTLEKLRLLSAINGDLVEIKALSNDYLLSVITKDERSRGDGIRSAYISFSIENGGEDEFTILSSLVDWASKFEPVRTFAPGIQVTILSNDIDWAVRGEEFASRLGEMGVMVNRVTPDQFDGAKDSRIIVILGGPKAYDGVGDYVKEALTPEEQEAIIKGERGIFVKRDVWGKKQIVIVLAGQGRTETGQKVERYENAIDSDYLSYLAEFLLG